MGCKGACLLRGLPEGRVGDQLSECLKGELDSLVIEEAIHHNVPLLGVLVEYPLVHIHQRATAGNHSTPTTDQPTYCRLLERAQPRTGLEGAPRCARRSTWRRCAA